MEINEIHKLIEKFEQSSLSYLEINHKDTHIKVKKEILANPAQSVQPVQNVVANNIQISETTSKFTPVKSPIVGVFYSCPSPDSKAFVQEGSKVEKGDVIGIIEAMKMMSEVRANVSGIVRKIHAQNEQLVEFDDILIEIEE